MSKAKGKEIVKAAAAVMLSVGLFGAAFVGINNMAFAATANESAGVAAPSAEAAPTLTVILCENSREVSANALFAEDAALGARYVLDVFGECIGGLYVSMRLVSWPGNTRLQWLGKAGSSPDEVRLPATAEEWDVSAYGPMFEFVIDAVTRGRVVIKSLPPRLRITEEVRAALMGPVDIPFTPHYNGLEELTAFFGITPETLEAYRQLAPGCARSHFNNSDVVDIRPGCGQTAGISFSMPLDGSGLVVGGFSFIAADSTGRAANISISSNPGPGYSRTVLITTGHNDDIPGFRYRR